MIFRKKKINLKKAYEKLGLFCTVELSEVSRVFGVPILKIVTYYKGRAIKKEPFSEERWEEIINRGIPTKIIETSVKEFEKIPYNRILLGRLELPRINLTEEEV